MYVEPKEVVVSIEIPEVQELVFVIFALTERGLNDSVMIDHTSSYYKEVIQHFSAFKNEEIVLSFGKIIDKHYNQLRMDACNYHFDENNLLAKNEQFNNLSWGNRDYLKKHLKALQEFSVKSQFRDFFSRHRSYYDSLQQRLKEQVNIMDQHAWLEQNFPIHLERYRIFFSPLSYGMHATNSSLNEVVVWVSGPLEIADTSPVLIKAGASRMVFTEIDHNYVNPMSDLYTKEIRRAFRNRELWASGGFSSAYNSSYAIFNEYMTWAIFILYAKDKYAHEDFLLIKKMVEDMMVEYRGFPKFRWFSDRLLELYTSKSHDIRVSDLFLPMMEASGVIR